MTKPAKKTSNRKSKAAGRGVGVTPPPGMLVTRSGRFIAKPAMRGTIPLAKIRAAVEKLARAREG